MNETVQVPIVALRPRRVRVHRTTETVVDVGGDRGLPVAVAVAVAVAVVGIVEVAAANPEETICRVMRNWPKKKPPSI
ncbi:MAG: hypothetical protein ABGX04_00395, partial [Myxococcales bacterium]